MKFSNIAMLLTLLLPLNGYGEITSGANSQAGATSTQTNELFSAEQVAKYQKEAEAGIADAQFKLGSMYYLGEGMPKNAVKALEWLQKAATQGHTRAQYILGEMYRTGEGVPKDAAKAVEWHQKAAVQGDAQAQFKLGVMYEGVLKDKAKALEWYEKSAAQGYVPAERNIGSLYFFGGKGVIKDIAKAIEWQEKAANNGNAEDKFDLGFNFFEGIYVPKDAVKAFEWFQKAASDGNIQACYYIGHLYNIGEGVPKDAAKAFEWYLKAASQGDNAAQSSLSAIYESGEGVSRDLVRASAWFNLAAASETNEGMVKYNRLWRNQLEKRMTPVQRAEGQRLASNWKKGDTMLAGSTQGVESAVGKPSKQSTGTAFAVSSDGHALTNHHVINGCTEVKVAGRDGVAKVITSDRVNDLALLQLPGKSSDIAKLNSDTSKLRQGEDIIVFGYPLNFVLSSGGNLTPGTISALTGLGNNTSQIQITAPIQAGSSGSPVMDKKGNVVGVVSMKLDDGKMAQATGQVGQNVNFAVNGQTVRAFLDANKVPYKTGGGFFSHEKSNADIADEARKWTVLVECWK